MTIAELAVRVSADMQQFEKATTGMGQKLQTLGKQVSNAGMSMTKWVTGPILAAGTGLFALAQKTANAGDEVQKMALRTGFSTETLSELRHVAALSGTSIEQLETGVKRMSRVIVDAERGMESSTRAFDALGVSVEDLMALSPEDQFVKLASALADVEDDTLKAALAQEIFGRAGTQLLPMLASGAEGLEAMRQEAHDLGLIFDQEAADAAAKFNDDLTRLKGAFTGVMNEVGQKLIPVIVDQLLPALQEHLIPQVQKLGAFITRTIDWFQNLSPSMQQVVGIAIGLAVAIGPVLLVLGKLIAIGGTLTTVIKTLVGMIGKLGGAIMFLATNPIGWVILAIGALIAIGVLLYKNWDTVRAYAIYAWEKISAATTQMVAYVGTKWNELKLAVYNAISAILDLIAPLAKLLPSPWREGFEQIRQAVADKTADINRNLESLAATSEAASQRASAAVEQLNISLGRVSFSAQEAERDMAALSSMANVSSRDVDGLQKSALDADVALGRGGGGLAKTIDLLDYQFKRLDNSLRLLELTMEDAENNSTFLAQKQAILADKVALVTNQITLLEEQYRHAVAAKGLMSQAAMDLALKIDDLKLKQAEWTNEINGTVKAMEKLEKTFGGDAEKRLDMLELAASRGFWGLDEKKVVGDIMGIPSFQFGGIVPGPIGTPRLAVVHGGETVLPTHRSSGGSMTIVVEMDGRQTAKAVVPYIPGELVRVGVR